MPYLLDTCVISEFVSKSPNPKLLEYVNRLDPADSYLSVITIGEVKKGITKLPPSRRRNALEQWLNESLLPRFSRNLLLIDLETMFRWGELVGNLQLKGRNIGAIDSLLAAQALRGALTVVTRNVVDFADTGVTIENPWA